jgi:hypothetical protein
MESKRKIIQLNRMFVNYIPMTCSARKIMGNKRTIEEMEIYENEDGDEGEIEKKNALNYM